LHEEILLRQGYYPGLTKEELRDKLYFTIETEDELAAKWATSGIGLVGVFRRSNIGGLQSSAGTPSMRGWHRERATGAHLAMVGADR
jgi:hypothetical protein